VITLGEVMKYSSNIGTAKLAFKMGPDTFIGYLKAFGFGAETGDATGSVLDLGRAKLARKGCDLLVVNDVSGGAVFGSADNEAVVLAADGAAVEVPRGSKTVLAHVIWDEVSRRFAD
jgi:phosphopantothenoylcysteine synthetase/decarboxylase